MKISQMLKEFCSSNKEWHYFITGVAIGWTAGISVALIVSL